jgi:hypothetical protein
LIQETKINAGRGGIMKTKIFLTGIIAFFISQTAYAKTLYYDIKWESSYNYDLEINGILSSKGDFRINSWTIDGVEAYKITIEDSVTSIYYTTWGGDDSVNVAEIWLPGFDGYFEGFDFLDDRVYGGWGRVIVVEDPNHLLTLDNLGNYFSSEIFENAFGPFYYLHNIDGYEEWGPTVTISEHKMNAPVPEPATMILFGAGLAGLVGVRLRRKK